jgi:hypothetical protein
MTAPSLEVFYIYKGVCAIFCSFNTYRTQKICPPDIYGDDRCAYNLSREPGGIVLHESHSFIHGHPFPLKGHFFANMFIHFQPLNEEESVELPLNI